jgi:hypothetical protein
VRLTEEHDDDETDDTTGTSLQRGDGAGKGTTSESADTQEERSRHKGQEGGSHESADGKGDQSVREHLRSLGVGETTVLVGVVQEEGTDGDLSTDVAELGGETVEDSSVGHLLALLGTVHGGDDLVLLGRGVGQVRLGQLGEEVGGGDANTGDSDRKVDVLYVCVRVLDIISKATRKKPR